MWMGVFVLAVSVNRYVITVTVGCVSDVDGSLHAVQEFCRILSDHQLSRPTGRKTPSYAYLPPLFISSFFSFFFLFFFFLFSSFIFLFFLLSFSCSFFLIPFLLRSPPSGGDHAPVDVAYTKITNGLICCHSFTFSPFVQP